MMYCETIVKHYESVWSNRGQRSVWMRGRRSDLPLGFSVLRVPPSDQRSVWTYATVCMSEESDEERLELHLFSPVEAAEHVELLTATAHFHRTSARLGLGHTINFGRPWMEGSKCTHGLISLPYLDGPELEALTVGDKVVRFLWLVPVTEHEVEFKKHYGLEALEDRLEQANFNYVDPQRGSVV